MSLRRNLFVVTLLVAFSAMAAGMYSCKKEEPVECLSYEPALVTKVEGPATTAPNETVELEVSFGCHSGCGRFGMFRETVSGNMREIEVVAKYEGCICTQDAPTRKGIYYFVTGTPGVYYLKFYKGSNSYIMHTISVQ